jgi:hypothetical protein
LAKTLFLYKAIHFGGEAGQGTCGSIQQAPCFVEFRFAEVATVLPVAQPFSRLKSRAPCDAKVSQQLGIGEPAKSLGNVGSN